MYVTTNKLQTIRLQCSVYVTCKGLSDLGNRPNKPTATIIGEYSASYHHGALTFTLIRLVAKTNRNFRIKINVGIVTYFYSWSWSDFIC